MRTMAEAMAMPILAMVETPSVCPPGRPEGVGSEGLAMAPGVESAGEADNDVV